MFHLHSTRLSNRHALQVFIAVLSAFIIIAAIILMILQNRYLQKYQQNEMKVELTLLGEMITDSLLRSDYSSVENLVDRWANSHEYIHDIKVVMPNGFVLAQNNKNYIVKQPVKISHHVKFNDKTLAILQLSSELYQHTSELRSMVIFVTVTILAFILLLGWLLWSTLKRTAIIPLQTQIEIREQKERELLHRTLDLEAALSELESFSYSVSHDLRAPLRAIDGFSRIIEEDYADKLGQEAKEHLTRVRKGAHRMGALIDELLELSRVSRRELNKSDIDMSSMAGQIMDELKAQTPERQALINIEQNIFTQADPDLLYIVLNNLLGNAWKYTSKKPSTLIEFRCIKQPSGPPLYCVSDNGVGFDMQFADKLFKPFQRLHKPEDFAGSGIGLATVKRIIQRHGGRIWAEGQTGHGARFCFTLTQNGENANIINTTGNNPLYIKQNNDKTKIDN